MLGRFDTVYDAKVQTFPCWKCSACVRNINTGNAGRHKKQKQVFLIL